MRDFRELAVWQRAHRLTLEVYRATRTFPPDERHGLTTQLRRSTSSIAMNIAEGCGRATDVELVRFLSTASGAASGTEYHLMLALDLEYLQPETYDRLVWQVYDIRKGLAALHQMLTVG